MLARCLHEAPVYHGALMQDQVVLLQKSVEFIEQLTAQVELLHCLVAVEKPDVTLLFVCWFGLIHCPF